MEDEAKKVEYTEKRISSGVIRRRRVIREEEKKGPPKEEVKAKPEKAEPPQKAKVVPEKGEPRKEEPPRERRQRFVRIPKEKVKPARVVGRIELKPEAPPEPQKEAERAPAAPPEEPLTLEVQMVEEAPKKRPLLRREEEEKEREEKRERKVPKRKGRRPREVVTFDEEELEEIYTQRKVDREYRPEKKRTLNRPALKPQITTPKAIKRKIRIEEEIGVLELAQRMGVKLTEIEQKMAELGIEPTPEGTIDVEAASLLAADYGFEVESVLEELEAAIAPQPDPPEMLRPRPPVVTVMGHVDHGKTLLLDAIRQTNVAEREVGGITQKIGAYKVEIPKKGTVTFIDTPGHEAFTAMRARGAQVTDIVVLVVAADDGVMPQTVEAINHAKAAGVPIIVAINKIDKKEANPERVRRQLSEHGLIPEEWGGDTLFVEVSALKKVGIEDLLEMILLQAEMMELEANPSKPGRGVVIETRLDRGKGPVGTVIVKEGTLKEGNHFVSGLTYGRIRAMEDEWGKRVKEAPPSTPVEVIGFQDLPQAGDDFVVVKDEETARAIAELRQKRKARLEKKGVAAPMTLEELFERIQQGETKELRLVLKADTFGSLQAIKGALEKLSKDEVRVRVIHEGVGGISDSDVNLALASQGIVVGFNVQPIGKAKDLIAEKGVDVRTYKIIYDLLDDIQRALKGMLEPKKEEVVLGRAEVKAVFQVPRVGAVAGCYVLEGKIVRGASVRVLRDGEILFEGRVTSLKRFKEDVREVQQGYECGVGVEGFKDWKEGDRVEVYTIEEVPSE
ncbi:MAG: translation initiation factor IF-2 [Deltaproteobacteria bacterium]|nr:MAG: translation initiation factor IF-2 [Deltaproteobacteria bacterium]